MSDRNRHLELSELAKLLEEARKGGDAARAEDVHPHFAECEMCREQFKSLVGVDSQVASEIKVMAAAEPAPSRSGCPPAEVWRDIAGGVIEPEQTLDYIEHASGCGHCGPRLRAAVDELIDLDGELTDSERKQIAGLNSAKVDWQRRLAARITGTQYLQPKPSSWQRWFGAPGFSMRYIAVPGIAMILVAVIAWWASSDRSSAAAANRLLARAYSDQRTLELRFPGAEFARLQVQKGPAQSPFERSASLLKAEALIGPQLSSRPNDPDWLQAAARADVLETKYDAAVESLQRALELRPDSPDLLQDLATAYFERGRSEGRQEDFGAAFEALSRVLAKQPDNATALFNRALVAEYQYLYHQAVEDWDNYLKLDSTSPWAGEARSHRDSVRAKLKASESEGALWSAHQIASAATGDAASELDQRVEQYLAVAVATWLPQGYLDTGAEGDPQAKRALFFLADLTSQKHNDRWLADLLKGVSTPSYPRAITALARASQANHSGDYTAAREQASAAAHLFRSSGNQAGFLRAQFEQAYSDQQTRHTEECRSRATSALPESERLGYSWLQVQLELEKGVCSLLGKDDWGVDERLSRRAMERASASGYDELYTRALSFLADHQIQTGDISAGLKSAATGLDRYWSTRLPTRRGYALYTVLALANEPATRTNLQTAIWSEAAALIDSDDNFLTRASAHSYAARSASAANKLGTAEREYAEAARLFALAPRTQATTDYVVENEIRAAQLEARFGQFDPAIVRLTRIQDQIRPLLNKYLAQMFYSTLGEVQLRNHHPEQAEQAFQPALELAEQRLTSLNSESERLNWSRDAAPVYLGMSEAELIQGHTQGALEYFEWYLGAASRSGERAGRASSQNFAQDGASRASELTLQFTSRLPLLTGRTVVAYGALPDGLAIWSYDNRGVNAQWVPQSNQSIQDLVARFYDLASNPRSEVSALRRDSQELYKSLIAPIEPRLEPGRTLVIEADGWLAQVPFEALLDSNGHYLIERAPIVHSLGPSVDGSLHDDLAISPALHALIVGSTASSQVEGLVPLPDVTAEADDVAQDFRSPVVLRGPEATLGAVESELPSAVVFHFTGHSMARPTGAALMLDGPSSQKGPIVTLDADRLRRVDLRDMQLAVLSTCNTEHGNDGSRSFSSIAEALQRAGVPHVVASRWAVDSAAGRAFVDNFYRSALSGQTVSEAAREASLKVLSDPRTSHPYYWSAFSAYGRL